MEYDSVVNNVISIIEKTKETNDLNSNFKIKLIEQIKQRSIIGLQKYGCNLDREDYDIYQWINELNQELMDAMLYSNKISQLLAINNKNIDFKKTIDIYINTFLNCLVEINKQKTFLSEAKISEAE